MLTCQSVPDVKAYQDDCQGFISALNTLKKAVDDKAESLRREATDLKKKSRDIKDLMDEIKYAKSRARDYTFELRQEASSFNQ